MKSFLIRERLLTSSNTGYKNRGVREATRAEKFGAYLIVCILAACCFDTVLINIRAIENAALFLAADIQARRNSVGCRAAVDVFDLDEFWLNRRAVNACEMYVHKKISI
jgi:hypothetical protein